MSNYFIWDVLGQPSKTSLFFEADWGKTRLFETKPRLRVEIIRASTWAMVTLLHLVHFWTKWHFLNTFTSIKKRILGSVLLGSEIQDHSFSVNCFKFWFGHQDVVVFSYKVNDDPNICFLNEMNVRVFLFIFIIPKIQIGFWWWCHESCTSLSF